MDISLFLLECYLEAARVEDSNGWIALRFDYQHLPLVQELVKAYPESVRKETDDGCLHLHDACSEENPAVLQFLAQQYPLALLHKGYRGRLPIHSALLGLQSTNPFEVVELLIGLFPGSVRLVDDAGMLPIHYACRRFGRYLELVLRLTVQLSDDDGLLPLHHACHCNASREVMRLLMDSYHGDENHHKGFNFY